jgi:hypothetical protein
MHHTREGILFARFAPSEYHGAETLFLCARNESDVVHGCLCAKISLDGVSVGNSVEAGDQIT